jgi:hypothetical protein
VATQQAGAQQSVSKRLIMTDGSFQTVTEWKWSFRKVSYFSVDRGRWEDVDMRLVDWKATARWNAEYKSRLKLGAELGAGDTETPGPAAMTKRLILTDGSYQVAARWDITGQHVRYYSVERDQWEEVPESLVNWNATEQWNNKLAQGRELELEGEGDDDIEEAAQREPVVRDSPMVTPSLYLPSEGGVFLLEESGGQARLVKLESTSLAVHSHWIKTELERIPNPEANLLKTIELDGAASKNRVRSGKPAIFLAVEGSHGWIPGEDFDLVRLESGRNSRVVAKSRTDASGHEALAEAYLRSHLAKFSRLWWKLTPWEDLAPGEYAIVTAPGALNTLVWDFAVEK